MAKTIKIQSGSHIISIESDDAGVPDAGPDLLKLHEDAMAAPNEENAEFNAAIDDSPVESEDKTQDVDKANESFFNVFFGLEDGEEATVTDGEQSDTPTTPDETTTAPDESTTTSDVSEDTSSDGDGAGEITESDGVTTIDTGDTVITISNTNDSEPNETETTTTETETTTETQPNEGGESSTPDQQNTDQAIESFFANLDL